MYMIYLDNSATSFPKPESVYKEMDRFYRNYGANPGRSGHMLSIHANQMMESTRRALADLFNAPVSKNIAFTYNATDSLNIALQGVLLDGDEVITTSLDHNSLSRPLSLLSLRKNIKIVRIDPAGGKVLPGMIKSKLTKKTKLVVLNHASNVTGWIQPVEDIGNVVNANSGAFFLVDAAQTAGIIPIDVLKMKIDLLAFTGHKALYGPTGTGGLYVSDRVNLDYYRVGGSGMESETESHPEEMPFRLEAGTPNIAGIAGLAEGIRFINDTGIGKIQEKEKLLKNIMYEEMRRIKGIKIYTTEDPNEGIGIISFNLAGLIPVETASILESENIAVRAGLHCAPVMHKFLGTFPEGSVRISIGYFNTEEEIEKTLRVIREISG